MRIEIATLEGTANQIVFDTNPESDTVLVRMVKDDEVMATGVVFKAELKNAAKGL